MYARRAQYVYSCQRCSTTRDNIDLSKLQILSLAKYEIGDLAPPNPCASLGGRRPPAQGGTAPWAPLARKRAVPEGQENMKP